MSSLIIRCKLVNFMFNFTHGIVTYIMAVVAFHLSNIMNFKQRRCK